MREPREYEAPLCAQIGGDLWFPEQGGDTRSVPVAMRICNQCVHRLECAEWGINYEKHGIWGGLNPRQRQRIRTKRNIRLPEERIA
jgi:WhiB family redox-sensing transcriptional regulator